RHSRSRSRALIAGCVVVSVVAAAIGLAQLNRPDQAVADAAASSARAVTAGPTLPVAPTAPQELPSVENIPLLDGPTPAFIARSGIDAEIHAWTPGDPVRVIRTFPDVYDAIAED